MSSNNSDLLSSAVMVNTIINTADIMGFLPVKGSTLSITGNATISGNLFSRRPAVTITPTSDPSLATATKNLKCSESGTIFFVNISTYGVLLRLPTPATGIYYTAIMNKDSDGEVTKDFGFYTGSDSYKIYGNGIKAGAVGANFTGGATQLALDSSSASVNAGDRITLVSDGSNWYPGTSNKNFLS